MDKPTAIIMITRSCNNKDMEIDNHENDRRKDKGIASF